MAEEAIGIERSAGGPARPAPERARWPWLVFVAYIVTLAVGMVFNQVNGNGVVDNITYSVAFTMFGIVGLLIVTRDGRNRIGLILLVGSLIMVACASSEEIASWAIARGDNGAWVAATALTTNFGWLLGLLSTVVLLPLLFPDGHLPSRRWRPFTWCFATFLAMVGVSLLFGQKSLGGSGDDLAGIPNPLYVSAIGRITFDVVIGVTFPILFGLSVVSLMLRFRRSRGVERQQIKWVAFGLVLAFVGVLVGGFANGSAIGTVVGGFGYLVFPVTIGIAILRFHLYDLGLVVRKTLLYGSLAAFITAVYVGIVVGVGALIGSGDSQNIALSVAATAIVAVGFQPVRTRAERLANRLVYGKRATPYEVLAEFSGRMGEAYDDADVLSRMSRILGEGIAAERADVWLHVGSELRIAASWPDADGLPAGRVAIGDGPLPELPGSDTAYPVTHQGELLGALAVKKPASEPLTPADLALVSDLADQAGLVLRNVRLTEDLRGRLEDLKAAQTRIVRAQDEERRKLERNIHDGAQQQLVALGVKARLAQAVTKDPAKLEAMLVQIQSGIGEAIDDLRDLARGIYPPLLADQGLAAALGAQARKAAVPTTVAADGVGRFTQDVEATVYFSCLEGLQNVAKYAEATAATVTLRALDGHLEFVVSDDGRGFDPEATGHGTGLQGIVDRLAAIGGTVEVQSAPGLGTSLTGRIPVDAPLS